VALAGSQVKNPAYSQMLVGQQISTLTDGRLLEGNNRIINGNVMTGTKTSADGFLAAHATEVNVIPEGDDVHELFGWIMPRFKEFSTSRSYFSWLLGKKHEYVLDARVKGGERHIIMSNEYDRVFPMDIYPEYLVKAIIAGDIDKMEQLGIYEVAPEDFALCEFVDTSKLELQRIVRQGLDMLRKEN
jgi:Na+-transporting NADH:ubiquinone oxidoreductase subunit A